MEKRIIKTKLNDIAVFNHHIQEYVFSGRTEINAIDVIALVFHALAISMRVNAEKQGKEMSEHKSYSQVIEGILAVLHGDIVVETEISQKDMDEVLDSIVNSEITRCMKDCSGEA